MKRVILFVFKDQLISNILRIGFTAFTLTSSSTKISGFVLISIYKVFRSVFRRIKLHSLQGTSAVIRSTGINSLSGIFFCISWIIPLSLATKNVFIRIYCIIKQSLCTSNKIGHQQQRTFTFGVRQYFCFGVSAFSFTNFSTENCSCTWHTPSIITSRDRLHCWYNFQDFYRSKINFASLGNWSTIFLALVEVTTTSVSALRPLWCLRTKYSMIRCLCKCFKRGAGQLSANEQRASSRAPILFLAEKNFSSFARKMNATKHNDIGIGFGPLCQCQTIIIHYRLYPVYRPFGSSVPWWRHSFLFFSRLISDI